jgi:multidrug efflux pump
MIGVTLFGIFLTPIFFAIIDRITHTSLFTNRYVTAASVAFFYALKLKFLRPVTRAAFSAGTGLKSITKRKFGM